MVTVFEIYNELSKEQLKIELVIERANTDKMIRKHKKNECVYLMTQIIMSYDRLDYIENKLNLF